MQIKNIEKFFLKRLLQIVIVGVFLILLSNLLFSPSNYQGIAIAIAVLISGLISFLIKERFPNFAVILITLVALIMISYQKYMLPNSTTSLAIVLMIGFTYSVMLKGKKMWVMHIFVFIILNSIFIIQSKDLIRAGITNSVLYFIITYASGILKYNYDKIHNYLRETNIELNEKAKEIEAQNEELLQIQDHLSEVNNELESIVAERTSKITTQNEILLKYSYTNAHELRGPVARLLGLANVYKLEKDPEADFFIEKMVDEALEIDLVVKRINNDLEPTPTESISKNKPN